MLLLHMKLLCIFFRNKSLVKKLQYSNWEREVGMEKYLVHYFDYEVGNKRYVLWTQSRNANDQKKSTMYEAPTNNMYVTKLVILGVHFAMNFLVYNHLESLMSRGTSWLSLGTF